MLSEIENFEFKKKFGQNFITDTNFLNSVVAEFNIDNKNVLEIGAGAGTLTMAISKVAKKVVSVEIDKTLEEYLKNKFKNQNNVEFIFADFLKLEADFINQKFNGESFVLVANLPYYITSPIIFKMIEQKFNVDALYIMVQKEMGERIVASEKTKQYGAISVKIRVIGDAKIIKQVNRKMFIPEPNVDSVILEIKINKNKFEVLDKALLNNLINGAFQNRRKVFSSNIAQFVGKENAKVILKTLFNNELIRGEELSPENFVKLSNYITQNYKNS